MRDPGDLSEALPIKIGPPETGSAATVRPSGGAPVVRRLKRRADFVHAGKGKRWHGKTLSLHAAPARMDEAAPDPPVARIGYTLTKKVGNAVVRNRARRRLREAVRLCADLPAKPGHDYVIIGRIEAVRRPFAALGRDVVRAINDVHRADGRGHRAAPRAPRRRQGPRDDARCRLHR